MYQYIQRESTCISIQISIKEEFCQTMYKRFDIKGKKSIERYDTNITNVRKIDYNTY